MSRSVLCQFMSFIVLLCSSIATASQILNRPLFEKLEQLYDSMENWKLPTEETTLALTNRKKQLTEMDETINELRRQPLTYKEEEYLRTLQPKIHSQLALDSNEILYLSLCRQDDGTLKCPDTKTFKELQSLYLSISEIKNNNVFLSLEQAKKYSNFYDQLIVLFQKQRQDLIEEALKPIHEIEQFGVELGLKITLPKIRFGFENGQNGDADTDQKIESFKTFYLLLEENRSLFGGIHHLEVGCVTYAKENIVLTSNVFAPQQSPFVRLVFNLSEDACKNGAVFSDDVKNNFEKAKVVTAHLSNQTNFIQKFVEQTGVRLTVLKAEIEEVYQLVQRIERLNIRTMKKYPRGLYIATWGEGVEETNGDALSINISAKEDELLKFLDSNQKQLMTTWLQ